MPELRDLATVLVRPAETMRRILDGGRDRWTIQIVILAFLCSSVERADITGLEKLAPELPLSATLAVITLALIASALFCVMLLYLFSTIVTLAGRWLGGEGTFADVRAAMAWGLAPIIWAAFIRIPVAVYAARLVPKTLESGPAVMDFIAKGGLIFAAVVGAFEVVLYLWMAYVASHTIGEAMHFSVWKGLATIAIACVTPIVITVAAALTLSK